MSTKTTKKNAAEAAEEIKTGGGAAEVEATVKPEGAVDEEKKRKQEEQDKEFFAKLPDPCVYCGPSVRGVARQFTVYSREQMIGTINRINSQVRGIIQYYQCCTWVSASMDKYGRRLQLIAMRRLKQYKGKWIPANQVQNLPRVHQQHKQKIPSIRYRDMYIGFTSLTFCKWEKTACKNQAETPYTEVGRQFNFERTKKKRIQARLDEMYSDKSARAVSYGKWGKLNNFEFIMNRVYALNRDKLKCRVCGGWLISGTP